MKRRSWAKRIKAACEEVGTYRPSFDNVIETLASILEQRDEADALFRKSKEPAVVKHVNKAGAENSVINPMVELVNKLNAQALSYWRDLGLTPLGLKRIDEKALKNSQKDAFTSILEGIID